MTIADVHDITVPYCVCIHTAETIVPVDGTIVVLTAFVCKRVLVMHDTSNKSTKLDWHILLKKSYVSEKV